MSALVITGSGAVTPTGATPVADLPWSEAHVVAGLDFAEVLGRKTVRFGNRTTNLALVACGEALADAGFEVTDGNRDTVGVSFGTTCGSLSGAVEFGWDSFDRTRPHMVNPAAMPNTVLNTTAGAMAIRYGLRGANSTVAAGPLAGLGALRNAEVMLRALHADTMLVGAGQEFTGPVAWAAYAVRPDSTPGEGAAVFVLERADVAIEAGRRPLARLGAVRTHTGDVRRPDTICDAVAETLDAADVEPERVRWLAARLTGDRAVDAAQRVGLGAVVPLEPAFGEHGDCFAGHAALQLADLVARARTEGWTRDDAGVVVAADPDGALAVAVVTGWSDDDNPLSQQEDR